VFYHQRSIGFYSSSFAILNPFIDIITKTTFIVVIYFALEFLAFLNSGLLGSSCWRWWSFDYRCRQTSLLKKMTMRICHRVTRVFARLHLTGPCIFGYSPRLEGLIQSSFSILV